MPVAKRKTSSVKKSAPKAKLSTQEENTLMDFEQFVSQKPKANKTKGWLAATLVFVILILASAWFFMWQNVQLNKEYKFKVVYLDNNQIYYAKVVKEDALNIYLDEVYYFQTKEQTIAAQEDDGEAQVINVLILVKRGGENYRPQGWMQINRSKVIAIEEMGPDSEILKEIDRQASL